MTTTKDLNDREIERIIEERNPLVSELIETARALNQAQLEQQVGRPLRRLDGSIARPFDYDPTIEEANEAITRDNASGREP